MTASVLALSLALGFAWDAYAPTTFAAFEERARREHPDLKLAPASEAQASSAHPAEQLRIRATYTGEARPLEGSRQAAVLAWAQRTRPDAAKAFQREIRVREGERERWLPIWEGTWIHLQQVARPGGELDLYVGWIGAVDDALLYRVDAIRPTIEPASSFIDPTVAVSALYARDDVRAYEFYSARLRRLFEEEERRAGGEVGDLSFDFIVNGQDTEPGWEKTLRIELVERKGDRAVVRATFRNFQDDDLRYTVVREDGRWLVDDVRSALGEPWVLSKILAP